MDDLWNIYENNLYAMYVEQYLLGQVCSITFSKAVEL